MRNQLDKIMRKHLEMFPKAKPAVTLDSKPAAQPPKVEEPPATEAQPDRAARRRMDREQPSDVVAEITAALEVLCEPGAWHELRTLNGNGRVTASGYFNNRELMGREAFKLNQRNNVYFSLNQVLPELSARAVNHVVEWPKHATSDDQIVSRQLFLVDVDPQCASGISGISATDKEHEAALERAQQIRQWLMEERSWPAPVVMDSGNGAYLLWRIALPNDDRAKQLLTAVLKVLARRFTDERVKVDTSTFNASRIARMPGTLNRKGDSTEERPHRTSRLLDVPSEWTLVSLEQLEQLASEIAVTPDSHAPQPASASPELQSVLTALEQRGITVKEPACYKDGLKYILSTCVFNPDHGGTSVAVIEYPKGAKQYSCLHDECRGKKKWGDVLRCLGLDKKSANTTASSPARVVISQLPDVREIAAQEVEFIVPGMLVRDTLTLLSGPPSAGKTTVALWLAKLISTGAEIFGGTCQQHSVLYLTRENPVSYIADIARRLQLDNGPDSHVQLWGDWAEEPAPAPASPAICSWVNQHHPFVIIDSLIAFFDGQNENDSREMRAFVNQGRLLLRAGACGILILHHPGKAESAKTYRGSSDLEPAIDAGYYLSNSGDRVLEQLYLKLWRPRFIGQKQDLVLHYRNNSFVADERRVAVYETVSQQLKNLFKDNQACTVTEFVRAARAKGLPQNKARSYLAEGVEAGTIMIEPGSHNRKFHRFADSSSVFAPDNEDGMVQ
jgi:hypothetical protein